MAYARFSESFEETAFLSFGKSVDIGHENLESTRQVDGSAAFLAAQQLVVNDEDESGRWIEMELFKSPESRSERSVRKPRWLDRPESPCINREDRAVPPEPMARTTPRTRLPRSRRCRVIVAAVAFATAALLVGAVWLWIYALDLVVGAPDYVTTAGQAASLGNESPRSNDGGDIGSHDDGGNDDEGDDDDDRGSADDGEGDDDGDGARVSCDGPQHFPGAVPVPVQWKWSRKVLQVAG